MFKPNQIQRLKSVSTAVVISALLITGLINAELAAAKTAEYNGIKPLAMPAQPIQYKTAQDYKQAHIADLTVAEDGLHFLVLGDWGRNGHYRQRQVADQMDYVMAQLDGHFVITTGDNFYPNGVASVNDPYWQTSFENIYSGPYLFEPWYVVLGNHDYRGNPQAQIDYSNISQRWNLPARYYSKEFELEDDSGKTALFVFMDTSPFELKYYQEAKYKAVHNQDAQAQLAWLKKTLNESDAHWKIVAGHHPLYSSGKRYQKTMDVRNALEAVFEQHGVDMYLAGHEHHMEHSLAKGKKVHHFISGAGSSIRKVAQVEFTQFSKATNAFLTGSLTSNQAVMQMVDYKGRVIYKTEIAK